MNTLLVRLFASALLVAAATADEVRLKDGRVLYGKVTTQGDTTLIETRDGVVRVPTAEIAGTTSDPELRADLRKLAQRDAANTPFGRLQLAVQARTWGLDRELWQHLDEAVAGAANEHSPALHNRLHDFLAQLEPELLPRKWRSAETAVRVRELLARRRHDSGPGTCAALLELLSIEPNADKDLRWQARRNTDPDRRSLAVEALLKRGTAGNDSFAWRTAILDRHEDVRAAAMLAARRYGQGSGAVDYLAPGLMHQSPEVRIRTAEAYGNLGHDAAVKLLVIAGPNAGKALAAADEAVRAHVAFLQQQAYIRDFDVEVAQASFIADPKIGVLQSGTVLDVAVHGVTIQRRIVGAYRGALQKLVGADPGADPRGWPSWAMEHAPAAQPAPATPGGEGR